MAPRAPKRIEWTAEQTVTMVVTPAVRVGGNLRSRRIACRSGTAVARRAEPTVKIDRCFRYYVDSAGRQHFNFAQQVWLQPQVGMAVTSVPTVALETLAVNLLTLATRKRDCAAAVGVTSRRVIQLARTFCTECLMSAGAYGWVMPQATVRAWLATRSRNLPRASR